MKFERKCPKCKKLITVDFLDDDDDEGDFHCGNCAIVFSHKYIILHDFNKEVVHNA